MDKKWAALWNLKHLALFLGGFMLSVSLVILTLGVAVPSIGSAIQGAGVTGFAVYDSSAQGVNSYSASLTMLVWLVFGAVLVFFGNKILAE